MSVLNPSLICTLTDLFSFFGAAACADVLFGLTPTTTTPIRLAVQSKEPTLHVSPSFLLSHHRSDHVKAVNKPSGAVVLPSRRHGKGNRRRSRRSVHADRPAPLPRCPTPHSSPPNQCLPTDTCRPFVTFLKASIVAKSSTPKERDVGTEVHRSTVALFCGHEDRPCSGGGNSSGSETYLSTQRRPRVEVVGYPQHPQNGKTQQYPGFPPHGCRLRFPLAVGLFRGSAITACLTRSAVSAQSCDVPIRQVSSVGPAKRREGAGSSQPTSARLEGKG